MDMASYARFVLALLVVLGLIAALAWFVRRYGPAGIAMRVTGHTKRLAIVEIAPVDARRRLVLVSRDGVEHLLLIGGANDLVIENARAAAPSAERPA